MIGRAVSVGGGGSKLGAIMWALYVNTTGSQFKRFGSSSTVTTSDGERKYLEIDNKTFSEDDGIFTCLKAGSYTFVYCGKANYNGGSKKQTSELRKNGSVLSPAVGGEFNNTGGTWTTIQTCAVGDTFEVYVKHTGDKADDGFLRIIPN